ncbi:glutamate decarboxylase eukaryotic type [Vibrio astriarenae]|nr:glutamate decarboxylase eukaryotic type [Vibrio sp. C7]
MAMLVYAAMHIISRPGYEMLIDQGIEKADYFANLIQQQADFELISQPELCLLTYRYVPKNVREALKLASPEQQDKIHQLLNELTKFIQKRQRETGRSFVSRTQLNPIQWALRDTIVFRVVLANPLTSKDVLTKVLEEQRQIATKVPSLINKLNEQCLAIQSAPQTTTSN